MGHVANNESEDPNVFVYITHLVPPPGGSYVVGVAWKLLELVVVSLEIFGSEAVTSMVVVLGVADLALVGLMIVISEAMMQQ